MHADVSHQGLDGRRTLNGDVTPGVELDGCDSSGLSYDLRKLDRVRPRRETELSIQHGR